MTYYTSIILLTLLALSVLCVLVWENGRLSERDKRMMHLTYAVVALSALAEWLGVRFSGNPAVPVWVLRAIKCADYILTPIAGGVLIAQLRTKNVLQKAIFGILAVNTVFQLVSCFTGWMIVIDDQNHYAHGPLYIVYILLYLLLIAMVIFEFAAYGKRFSRQNRRSLYAVLLLVVIGILMQEIVGGGVRTAYISLALGMSMMYIHYAEFSHLATDAVVHEQLILITTDALTGLASRHAYAMALNELAALEKLPEDTVVFSIDINGLKETNDSLGHKAGDELIRGAASCISRVLSAYGTCYRTGGDEFIVISKMDHKQADEALAKLAQEAAAWHGEKVKSLSLAAGYALASEHPEMDAERLIQEADMAMYAQKTLYYGKTEFERRKHRGG